MAIRYVEGSFAGPFCEAEYESLKQLIQVDSPQFELESDYLEHMRFHNGGIPINKSFNSRCGITGSIDFFLNFVDTTTVDSVTAGHNILAFLDDVEDELIDGILPFAIVGGGNFLCFDYSDESKPPNIVIWYLETSKCELVADSFAQFLSMLQDEAQ